MIPQKNPKFNINEMSSIKAYLFIADCAIHCDLKVIKKFCDQPNFKIKFDL